jgi:orotidine-5'-phosphate decarboxylase
VERDFLKLANTSWNASLHVCVGLDIDLAKIPRHIVGDDAMRAYTFAQEIIDATSDVAGAYKPNTAFFEALGGSGPSVLQDTIRHIHHVAPNIPVIVDAKRADIATSNAGSVDYIFEYLGADATTVHPYLGHEALRPFLNQQNKGIFVLCRTSNPGAGELQDLNVGGEPLFLHVANLVARDWNHNSNCGLVVGATYPKELATIRGRIANIPLLIPGIGAQGGDLEATIRALHGSSGLDVFINVSRSVLYASEEADFAQAARAAVTAINWEITDVLSALS